MSDRAEKTVPILAGVVGWPVDHSLSPLIHAVWAHRAGVDGYYLPFAVPPNYDDFARTMDSLRTLGFAGVNVTMPHKEHALRYADAASEQARAAGAANMLTFHKNAGCFADNSDVTGFRNALLASGVAPQRALIIGAGGAAKSIILALAEKPFATKIDVTNRTKTRAEETAAPADARVIDWNEKENALGDYDLVVNATPLGMSGQPSLVLDLARLSPDAAVADIVYSPLETPLLKAAKKKGGIVLDGLSMLMHQAAPGFEAWFGAAAEVDDALRAALSRELERRAA